MKTPDIPTLIKELDEQSINLNIKDFDVFDVNKGLKKELEFERKETIKVIKPIFQYLKGISNRKHVILYGPRGSGKTSIVNYYINEIKKIQRPIEVYYVNCRKCGSIHQIYKEICKNKCKRSDMRQTFEKLMSKGDNKKILILDEYDAIADNTFLYVLSRDESFDNVVSVIITRDPTYYENISDDVISSLNHTFVSWPAYTEYEIFHILKKRAEYGLHTSNNDIIEVIARLNAFKFESDVRIGIRSMETIFKEKDKPITDPAKIEKIMTSEYNNIQYSMLVGLNRIRFLVLYSIYKESINNTYKRAFHENVQKTFCKVSGLSQHRFRQVISGLIKDGLVHKEIIDVRTGKRYKIIYYLNIEEEVQKRIKDIATCKGYK